MVIQPYYNGLYSRAYSFLMSQNTLPHEQLDALQHVYKIRPKRVWVFFAVKVSKVSLRALDIKTSPLLRPHHFVLK